MTRRLVAIVMPLGMKQGGAEGLLCHLLARGRSRHNYICAFLQAGPLVEEIRSLGVETALFPTTQGRNLANYFSVTRSLRLWIARWRPDVILSWMPKAHIYVAPAIFFSKIPAMWYQHGTPRGEFWEHVETFLPSTAILCCSKTSRDFQERLFPLRNAVVCYPGVDLSDRRLSRQCAREKIGLPETVTLIGMVARLERWKGAHFFIEAAWLLANKLPHSLFFILGGAHQNDLPYAKEVQQQVTRANMGDRFLLLGQRTEAEVALWQTAADIMVHPSTGMEPFGMAVVEAMGARTPVIASDIGGPSEIITNGVDGLLVPPGDPVSIVDAVHRLLNEPLLAARLVSAALDRSHCFSIPAFQLRIDTILSGLADD